VQIFWWNLQLTQQYSWQSTFITLLHNACWCMMQCNYGRTEIWALQFRLDAGHNTWITSNHVFHTISGHTTKFFSNLSEDFSEFHTVSEKYPPQSWFPLSSEAQLILQLFQILHQFIGRIKVTEQCHRYQCFH
jgi:hypothetical protein